jgi:hypothetical protein
MFGNSCGTLFLALARTEPAVKSQVADSTGWCKLVFTPCLLFDFHTILLIRGHDSEDRPDKLACTDIANV